MDFFRLPTSLPPDFEIKSLLDHISYDKKKEHGASRWVTLRHLGSASWGESVDLKAMEDILRGLQKNE